MRQGCILSDFICLVCGELMSAMSNMPALAPRPPFSFDFPRSNWPSQLYGNWEYLCHTDLQFLSGYSTSFPTGRCIAANLQFGLAFAGLFPTLRYSRDGRMPNPLLSGSNQNSAAFHLSTVVLLLDDTTVLSDIFPDKILSPQQLELPAVRRLSLHSNNRSSRLSIALIPASAGGFLGQGMSQMFLSRFSQGFKVIYAILNQLFFGLVSKIKHPAEFFHCIFRNML